MPARAPPFAAAASFFVIVTLDFSSLLYFHLWILQNLKAGLGTTELVPLKKTTELVLNAISYIYLVYGVLCISLLVQRTCCAQEYMIKTPYLSQACVFVHPSINGLLEEQVA
jgi:hypothetical protein